MAEWEAIARGLDRIAVPGGWIYRAKEYANGGIYHIALTFVPAFAGFPAEPVAPASLEIRTVMFDQGIDACKRGDGKSANPYRAAHNRREWLAGYQEARAKIVESTDAAR